MRTREDSEMEDSELMEHHMKVPGHSPPGSGAVLTPQGQARPQGLRSPAPGEALCREGCGRPAKKGYQGWCKPCGDTPLNDGIEDVVMAESKYQEGDKVGRLTLLCREPDWQRLNGKGELRPRWRVRCDCGTEKTVHETALLRGLTVSCGCFHKEQTIKAHSVDLTGRKFGRWTVLRRARGKSKWLCRCECGKQRAVSSDNLKSGHSKSCGCLRREVGRERGIKDLTGQSFGRLTVIRQAEDYISPGGHNQSRWLCRCECGTEKVVAGGALTSGKTKSCGCLRREKSRQMMRQNRRSRGW